MQYFTLEEASAALAHVRPRMERLVRARRKLAHLERELQVARRRIAGNGARVDARGLSEREAQTRRVAAELDGLVEEIHRLGVQVKDLERGLVDFPAKHPDDGSTVLLCWLVGEDEIRYWHGLDEGFAGRKTLPF